MKTHHCICGNLLFFENVLCMRCQRAIGFLPDLLTLSSLDPAGDNLYVATALEANGRRYKKCLNYSEEAVCNWMVPEEKSHERFCTSCRLDQIIPNLTVDQNWTFWRLIENGKRRMIYSLLSLKLPVLNKIDDPAQGMSFRFMEQSREGGHRVLTGHDNGIITLNISEADDVERERMRLSMREPYRTILGHFRHEVGHYYWDRLVANSKYLEPFRALFGDERADYNKSLETYYANGAPPNWQENYVSAYALPIPGRTGRKPGPTICTFRTRSRSLSISRSSPRTSASPRRRKRKTPAPSRRSESSRRSSPPGHASPSR